MNIEKQQEIIDQIKKYITDNLPLSQLTDDELEIRVEEITTDFTKNTYISIEDKISIVEQVYSSIRGLGLLDSIIKDDSITEVMINGHENIFIEKNGKLEKLDKLLPWSEELPEKCRLVKRRKTVVKSVAATE